MFIYWARANITIIFYCSIDLHKLGMYTHVGTYSSGDLSGKSSFISEFSAKKFDLIHVRSFECKREEVVTKVFV